MKRTLLILIVGNLFWNCNSDKKGYEPSFVMIIQNTKQDNSFEKGKALFKENCVACHYIGMDKILTAPALGGITERRKKEWLYDYTRNSIGMYKNGDSIAIELRNQGWALMSSFPNLTDKNLDYIYYFIEEQYELTKNRRNE